MNADLYQAQILRAARDSGDIGRLERPLASLSVDNPLCGDRVVLDVQTRELWVSAIGFEVRGCLLCEAAAWVLASAGIGLSLDELDSGQRAVRAVLAGSALADRRWQSLDMFAPVASHRSRHRCVLLPFEALQQMGGVLQQG